MLQQMGGARQEDMPDMPACLPSKVCCKPPHQHAPDLSHPNGQTWTAASIGQDGRGVCSLQLHSASIQLPFVPRSFVFSAVLT